MSTIDCLRIELNLLHAKELSPNSSIDNSWYTMKQRLQESSLFEYHKEYEGMYEIVYYHLKYYECTKVFGEDFIFVQMVLISKVWDYPQKLMLYIAEKKKFISMVDAFTEEERHDNDVLYNTSNKETIPIWESIYPPEVFHFSTFLSDTIPVKFDYDFYSLEEPDIIYERAYQIRRLASYVQKDCVDCDETYLIDAAKRLVKKDLGTTPLFRSGGSLLVDLAYMRLSEQNQFLKEMRNFSKNLRTCLLEEVLEVFEGVSKCFPETVSKYYAYLRDYEYTIRNQINSPKECASLAQQYVLSTCTFGSLAVEKDQDIDGFVIFSNGTCVQVYDFAFPELGTLEERAKSVLKDSFESVDLFEYEPGCIEDCDVSVYGEKVYFTCSHGAIISFFWSNERVSPDFDIIRVC